jgi:predicted RecA/RadA family phage recombinase
MAICEATLVQEGEYLDMTAAVAKTGGEVIQLADGRAAVVQRDIAAAALGAVEAEDVYRITKTSGIVILDGGKVFWDYSANAAHYKKVNDQDFYVGVAVGDAASADTTMLVNLNVVQRANIDLLRDGFLSVPTGTAALNGFGYPQDFGDAKALSLTATSEVQCIDMLSVDKLAVAANTIAEFIIRPGVNGSTSAVDFNVGLANGTSASDADAVTEHVFFHVDGGSTAINAQSKDGTTTVTATDTTKVISAGSAVANRSELWIDTRDPSSVKLYVDGVRVLTGSTFDLSHATGPLGLLVHLEKSTGTATAGPIYVDRAIARTADQ